MSRKAIRLDRFEQQLAEEVIGEDSLQRVDLSADDHVTLYIPIDPEKLTEVMDELSAVGKDTEAGALVIFGHNPNVTAEEQLALWKAHGKSLGLLITLYRSVVTDVQERLGKVRPKA